jgi:hypothetical protein
LCYAEGTGKIACMFESGATLKGVRW